MKLFKKIFFFMILCSAVSLPVFALENDDMDSLGAAEKARLSHEKAASDMIYQNEEWKALYYQNQQIIQLLKEISGSLDVIKTRVTVKDVEK